MELPVLMVCVGKNGRIGGVCLMESSWRTAE